MQLPPLSSSKTFLSLQKEILYPLRNIYSHFFLPETSNLHSISMDLPLLNISYKWNHTICAVLCLASFTQHDVFKVHPLSVVYISTSFLFVAEYYMPKFLRKHQTLFYSGRKPVGRGMEVSWEFRRLLAGKNVRVNMDI